MSGAAIKRAQAVGVQVRQTLPPADARPEELVAALERVNRDDSVDACLLFRPLPEQLAPRPHRDLCPEKDVDGMTAAGLGGLMTVERGGFAPCTAAACMEMLRHYHIPLRGKNVTMAGTGRTVGMPLVLLLIQEDATVSACHLQYPPERRMELCRTADIIISAAGAAGVITGRTWARDRPLWTSA
ncbi:MAG: bifunctional 5,10-methylenetetrahydrofolate dehydrogenase/5,10-methenyltetrahydrofolate cyclohydrolase [Lawsonibacter sp.]